MRFTSRSCVLPLLQGLMMISEEKSQFLRLAYQAKAGGATNRGHLEVAEAEVQCLRGELEASQRLRQDLTLREVLARS
jgi:hypothetical protein